MAKTKSNDLESRANELSWAQAAANKAAGGDLSTPGPIAKGLATGKTPSGQGA